jgi:hypothetical protein
VRRHELSVLSHAVTYTDTQVPASSSAKVAAG